MKTFSSTQYRPGLDRRSPKLASYDSTGERVQTDIDAGTQVVAQYMKYHFQYNGNPHRTDGATKYGKRIRVLCRYGEETEF